MPFSPLVTPPARHDYAAFSDESHSDGGSRYMVIGGNLLRSDDAHTFASDITSTYGHRFPDIIQWKGISKRKLPVLKRVSTTIAGAIRARRVDFGCIIFDQTKVDHLKHSERDPDSGFFKFLYQHHLKWSRHYKAPATFRCFHGNMATGYDLNELWRCLNAGANVSSRTQRRPYRQFDFLEVRKHRCLQAADLFIGAVGYMANGKHRSLPASPRTELALHIARELHWIDLSADTAWPDHGMHIWRFRL